MSTKKQVIGAAVILVMIAVFCIVRGAKSYSVDQHLIQSCTATATGTVTNVYEYHRRGKNVQSVRYTFLADARSNSGENTFIGSESYKKGQQYLVHYNPENTSESYITDAPYRQRTNKGLIGIGAILLVLGIFSGLGATKIKEEKEQRNGNKE